MSRQVRRFLFPRSDEISTAIEQAVAQVSNLSAELDSHKSGPCENQEADSGNFLIWTHFRFPSRFYFSQF
jgi:hypothetical protein